MFLLTRNILRSSGNLVSKLKVENSIKCSTNAVFQYDNDPAPQFINEFTQKLLKSMTRVDVQKIFRKRSVSDSKIEYKFMSTEQLIEEYEKVSKKAEYQLHMPPVVKIKKDMKKVISEDPALTNFSDTPYVITDITYGLRDYERKVVVRNINGTLEYAPEAVHKRMSQIYFPKQGRTIRTPAIFEPDNLARCLNEQKYEFILDRLCIQYEPYDKDFHEISSKVYLHVNETKHFDDLRSTRHFGPMAFFLAWHKMIDDLLCDMIKRDFLQNGVELVCLLYRLHNIEYSESIHEKIDYVPPSVAVFESLKKSLKTGSNMHDEIEEAIGKTREDFENDDVFLEFLEDYMQHRTMKKVPLELAIQAFKETNNEKRKLYEGLKKAHGIN